MAASFVAPEFRAGTAAATAASGAGAPQGPLAETVRAFQAKVNQLLAAEMDTVNRMLGDVMQQAGQSAAPPFRAGRPGG